MTSNRILKAILVGSAGVLALSGAAAAQSASGGGVETVVVTGSRIITNGNDSPTPLTVVPVEQLQLITPSDVPDGLNKLPVFAGSSSQQTVSNAAANGAGNFLNLRDFGSQRTLILLDGNRVPNTASNGTVDIDTLPQMLMTRVDVVTGGASAVYGSDAVTGVVNFILDHNFNGLKTELQSGVSTYGDDASWKAGIAWGKDMFHGKGHFEVMFERYNSDGIDNMADRPLGNKLYTETGLGTAAVPYTLTINSREVQLTPGGYIENGPLAGMYSPSNGVLAPYSAGIPCVGNAGCSSGGDGGYSGESAPTCVGCNQSLIATLRTAQTFARFDYDLFDNIHAYVQASGAQDYNYNSFYVAWFNQPVPSTNAYLPPAAAATLAAAGTPDFGFERSFANYPQWASEAFTQNVDVTFGLTGTVFSDYNWNFHYTYGQTYLDDANPNNTNDQNLTAALDSVTNSAGQVVCRATLNNVPGYANCQALDPFGPTAPNSTAVAYVDSYTYFHQFDGLNDFAGDVSGPVFNGWAGPIKAALSAEYRNFSLETKSNFTPSADVNCTGLNPVTCNPKQALWAQNTVGAMDKSEGVWEVAGETDIPLLKDLPLVELFDINLAGRYTQYSISGPATTWKLGGVWNVINDFNLRGTVSRDIRAPTLFDLFSPTTNGTTGYQDLLTGVTANVRSATQGNPALKPEVSRTNTAGFVFTPHWVPNLSIAVDAFQISIDNAITSIAGTSPTIENLCNSSNGTSPYCALYIRPISATSTSPANYPIEVLSESLNVNKTTTHGIDGEVNYHFDLADIDSDDLEGSINNRLLVAYQPTLLTFSLPGAAVTNAAGAVPVAAGRVTFDMGYVDGPYSINGEERWHSSERQNSNPQLVFNTPSVPDIFYTDIAFGYAFKLFNWDGSDNSARAFLSIQNLMNQQPHVWIPTGYTSAPGFAYPVPKDEDVVGRYFTLGIKYRL